MHIFTLDDVSGEFYLTKSNVQIPESGTLYCFNDANSEAWDPAIKYFISDLKSGDNPHVTPRVRSARYMGALVADAHNLF